MRRAERHGLEATQGALEGRTPQGSEDNFNPDSPYAWTEGSDKPRAATEPGEETKSGAWEGPIELTFEKS